MYSASDLRRGLRVEIEGVPYTITDFTFVKPGKGQGMYTCKMKNLLSGSTITRVYRDNVSLGEPKLEEKHLRFSYAEGDSLVFVDDNYEQMTLASSVLGDLRAFLVEDMEVSILFHNDRPIDVTLPTFVEKEIIHTEPGARGNTATNVLKPAQIPGGHEIRVPLFVNQGDVVRIDTRTGEYVDRVTKK
jgi:elongation factor P